MPSVHAHQIAAGQVPLDPLTLGWSDSVGSRLAAPNKGHARHLRRSGQRRLTAARAHPRRPIPLLIRFRPSRL